MFKITAIYNDETFNAKLPDGDNALLLLNKKSEDKSNKEKKDEKEKKEIQVPMSDLEAYYLERFLIVYRGNKTGVLKLIANKNIIILGITDSKLANKLRFYESDGKQWCKNINFSDAEKLIIERYDFLTKEKTFTEYTENIETLLKIKLSGPKREEYSNEQKEEHK